MTAMGIALCLLTACSKTYSPLSPEGPVEVGFYAGGDGSTRSVMNGDGLSASWSEGDRIAVWARNSSSSYILAKQAFGIYGFDGGRAFFSSVLSSEMPEDSYTYFASYPEPIAVNGTSVDFNLPSVQDGKVSGGADIMIAEPVSYGALKALPEIEDHSGMSMSMKHVLHQLRFWLPAGTNTLGEPVSEIVINMPFNVSGTVTADFSDPDSAVTLSGGSDEIRLRLAEPLAESEFPSPTFACAAIAPHIEAAASSDSMRLTIYSHHYKSVLEPLSLSGRSFVGGHSTPVKLVSAATEAYYRLSFHVGANHIGEALWNISISQNGTRLYTWANTAGYYGDFSFEEELLGAEGKAAYDQVVAAIADGTAVLNFETAHASVDIPLQASCLTLDDNLASIELGEVPYLLEEDFSTAVPTAHDDDYTASSNSDRNVAGYLLDGYLPRNGWNAARFAIFEGDCIRINCRYQSGAWVVERWCGRLDTPAMSYLKPDASVTVVVEYDEAFYVPAGYNRDDSATAMACYRIGTHSNAESSKLDGCKSDNIASNASIVFTSERFASEDVSAMHSRTQEIASVGATTRIVFFADTGRTTSVVAANAVYYLYLDNIRVYIKN